MEKNTYTNDILSYRRDPDGVAVITIDMKDQPTNLFSFSFVEKYLEAAEKAVEDPAVTGLIIDSARRDFMAGADLKFLGDPPEDRQKLLDGMLQMHRRFRKLEKSGKPFAAVLTGNCLGGGYELSLTCHRRFALDDDAYRIGLPEVKLGVFPGGGATQRLPHIVGIEKTMKTILMARRLHPRDAFESGLVDELVDERKRLIPRAKKWILETRTARQPWDDPSHRMPGGKLMSPSGFQTMVGGIGNLRKKTHGNYPGAQYALSAMHDGLQIPIDRGLEVEARYFIKAFYSPEAQNLIRTGFFFVNDAKKGEAKPEGYETSKVDKLGVIGAGMMGAGIAYVSALAGMEVILADIDRKKAEAGKDYSRKRLDERLKAGKTKEERAAKTLDRISPTGALEDLEGCSLVIEAVFEDPELKARVTREAEKYLEPAALTASNTSTLPITRLAGASRWPENFIGIHFFSPVEKMPLVEIIMGEKTSDYALASAIDYVGQIGKVPIVVNDSQGFFTSRVFGTYTGEGTLLLSEGVPPAVIENVARRVGMPVGPLAVADEVSLTLGLHVMDNMPEMPKHRRRIYEIYDTLVNEYGRAGKKVKKGFYEYPDGKEKHLWKGLTELFPPIRDYLDPETVGKRLLHIMALESYRCLEEGVLRRARDGDVGSMLGFGFPPYTGGVFSYIDYVGPGEFVADCDDFADRFGPRFEVPDSLRERAAGGNYFYANAPHR